MKRLQLTPVSAGSTAIESTNRGSENISKKIQKVPKGAKLQFAVYQQLFTQRLHCIYNYVYCIRHYTVI